MQSECALYGTVPEVGEQVTINGCIFQPLEVNSHRVNKVLITPPAREGEGYEYEDD